MRPFHSSILAAASLSGVILTGCAGGGSEPRVGPPAVVQAVSGASSGAIVAGTGSPLTLVAKVADAGGHAVSGVAVTWSAQAGSITPATSTTDGTGQASAQWTTSKTAGTQTASAVVTGVGTATFAATVTAASLAKLKVAPDTVKMSRAAETAQLSTTGSDPFDNPITAITPTFTVDDPRVATVGGAGTVTAVATGMTVVRASSGSVTGSSVVVVNIPSGPAPCVGIAASALAVGESATLSGPAASSLCVQGSTGAEFVAVPVFTPMDGSLISVTFNPVANASAAGPPSPNVQTSVMASPRLRAAMNSGGRELTRDVAWEARFRERARHELRPKLASMRSLPRRAGSGLRGNISAAAAVAVGDQITLNVNVDSACRNPDNHIATVKAVSDNAIVVEDNADPAGFTAPDYQFFAAAFDTLVFPVDTTNFGVPSDLDKNGKVILFFTTTVNKLTPSGSPSGFVAGFFYGRDLIPKNDPKLGFTCTGSNEAEIFYLLAPDPQGTINKNVRSTSLVRRITVGTVAHEFQHLINFAQHWISPVVFTDFESSFLDEGLAHEAEELVFYRAGGLTPKRNLDVSAIGGLPASDAFFAYQNQNAVRFREFLKSPSDNTPYAPDNVVEGSLAARGGSWSFLRYAADRKGTAEKAIWRQLVSPSSNVQGLANLKVVFGADIGAQVRDWAVANYVDDRVGTSRAEFKHPSWNTASIETFVNGNPGTTFPLETLPLVNSPVAVTLVDGGAAYLRFGVGAGSVGGATVTTSTAGALPASFSITVVRTK